ncbi:MAG: hypothetical protein HDT29_06815 [Clostridiales bacterium]|nr:hypothetical protein [Clostridiales bacterium]
MAYDYGYDELSNKLIELFYTCNPDYKTAEELIKQGADVNAIGKNDDENILSTILSNFGLLGNDDNVENENGVSTVSLGVTMCDVIRFFLNHGFDVTKCDGRFGAQCLYELTLSTCDKYMIEATKILLDAGAQNCPTSLESDAETPRDFMGYEGCFQDSCECNHHLGNIYEAVYQIYQAIEDGKPYSGIDSYEKAIGKKILKILAKSNNQSVFYPLNLPQFSKKNCYTATLYFIYEGGALISTQYADFWTDTVLPDEPLIDVSQQFEGIVGSEISGFKYDHKTIRNGTTSYDQPITTLEMSSGSKVRFSINFGEVNEEDRAAYFELL